MFSVKEILAATNGKLVAGSFDIKLKGISIDSRSIKPGELFIAIKGENFDGHNFIEEAVRKKAQAVLFQNSLPDKIVLSIKRMRLKNSKNPLVFIAVSDTIKALGDISRYHRRKFNIPVIAVTGSNGKTTTKEMIAHLLSSKFRVLKNEGTQNNQIGLPLTLLRLNSQFDIAVLELGTNHFGEIEYLSNIADSDIAVFTNIGPSHLEFFGDMEGVLKEKRRLLENLRTPSICLLNADDNVLFDNIISVEKSQKNKIIFTFGLNRSSDFQAQKIVFRKNLVEFSLNKEKFTLNTLARYNVYNGLAAILSARIFGLSYDILKSRLKSFEFLSGRLKRLCLRDNIEIIDDSYNSNPLSTAEALDVLQRCPIGKRKIFVMGDMLELGQDSRFFHAQIGEAVAGSSINVFFTLGEFSKLAARVAKDKGQSNKIIYSFDSKEKLNETLLSLIKPRDSILIKGSRAMKIEDIVNSLSRNFKP